MILYLVFKVACLGMIVSVENIQEISLYSNILVVFKTLGYYLWLLLFPFNLNAERLLIIPKSLFEPAVFFSGALLVLLVIVVVKAFRYSRTLTFAVVWIFLTLLPASNIIFLAGRPIAEQRLYIPAGVLGWEQAKNSACPRHSQIPNLALQFRIFDTNHQIRISPALPE